MPGPMMILMYLDAEPVTMKNVKSRPVRIPAPAAPAAVTQIPQNSIQKKRNNMKHGMTKRKT
jgi:hypothetical protein